jgi:hypothetical protein
VKSAGGCAVVVIGAIVVVLVMVYVELVPTFSTYWAVLVTVVSVVLVRMHTALD